jgi:small-conductance mechanosensitive channel
MRSVTFLTVLLVLSCVPVAEAQDSAVVDTLRASKGALPEIPFGDVEELEHTEGDSLATVILAGKKLFPVRSLSMLGASGRAEEIAHAIESISSSIRRRPEDIHLVRDDRIGATVVLCDTEFVVATFDYEARRFGLAADDLARQRAEIIRQAMIQYREDFSARSLIRGGIITGVGFLTLVVGLTVLTRARRRLEELLRRRLEGRTVFRVLSGESLISLATGTDRLVWFGFVIWIWLMFLNFALGQFPWTYGFASQVWALASGPAKIFGRQALNHVPSLFFLAFIFVVTVFINRGLRFVFDEIGARRIYIRGFYPDWARPTFNIARLIVIGLAVVVAIPYIPGSGSGAFKGMSLFVGVLVSLGSGSAMANTISGVIMIYMRPFEIGDRVQIGQTVGDVVDRNLLTTKVRTPKNERVTIPNTTILSGQIINFTSRRRTSELILHTTLTLGYDVSWRQVHELLINAAKQTENILESPEPFVLQRALQDFYVEYELNAYTDEPRAMQRTYSELHQNIQDQFIEAGVEILSPHYRAHRKSELGIAARQETSPRA